MVESKHSEIDRVTVEPFAMLLKRQLRNGITRLQIRDRYLELQMARLPIPGMSRSRSITEIWCKKVDLCQKGDHGDGH